MAGCSPCCQMRITSRSIPTGAAMIRFLKRGILGLTVTLLVACSSTIHKVNTLPSDKAVTISVDARQRFLLISEATKRSSGASYKKYCAEPSPDVFSVIGQAASANGSFGKSGSPASVNAAVQAAFSSSEVGSTIPRTQTINMLREMMYRTCERYLSGALSETEFPIQAARDQRIMVSLLAIEQLTGVVTPKSVAIQASGNANGGTPPAAGGTGGGTPQASPSAPTTSTTAGALTAPDPATVALQAKAASDVVAAVREIVSESFSRNDETDFFCYKILDPEYHKIQLELSATDKSYDPSELAKACLTRITNEQKAASARFEAEYMQTQKDMDANYHGMRDKILSKLNLTATTFNPSAVSALIAKYMADHRITSASHDGGLLSRLGNAQTVDEFDAALMRLSIADRNALAQ